MAVVAWGSLFYGNGFYLVALAERHGWSASLIASAITVSFLACIPSSVLVGWVFDRYGHQFGPLGVVVYGALAMSAGVAALGQIQTLWQLYLAYVLLGSAYPALAAPAISATLNLRVRHGYGLALTFALTGASVGGMLAAPGFVWSSATYGFDTAVAVLAILIVVIVIPVAAWVLWPRPGGDSEPPETAQPSRAGEPGSGALVAKSLRSPVFRQIALASFLSLVAQVGFLAHQLNVLGQTLAGPDAAWLVSATAAASMVGRFVVGGLSAYLPTSRLAALAYGVQAAGILVVACSESLAGLFAGAILTGLFVGAIVMLPPMLCRENFAVAVYGRVYGCIAIGVYLGGGTGPSVAALVADATGSYFWALLTLSGISLLAAWSVAGTSGPTR